MTRLLIDATSTIESGLNTGIQRVVRNICRYVPEYAVEDGLECHIIAFDGRQYNFVLITNVEETKVTKVYRSFRTQVAALLPSWTYPVLRTMRRAMRGRWIKVTVRWIPEEGDILLLADASWNYRPWVAVKDAQLAKVKILHIVYDLLPLKHPNFFLPELVLDFKYWWDVSNDYIDSYICISKSVEDDVIDFLHQNAKARGAQVLNFPLGADYPLNASSQNSKVAFSVDVDKAHVSYLMVGTIEPRKNHSFVLDAFDRLWSEGNSEVRLIIIGRKGWQSELFTRRIYDHPEFGRLLLWLDDCSDAELDAYYQSADVLIAASIDEGYGLPIIEAEFRGLQVLASDIKVFREVANSAVQFFSLTDVGQLVDRLKHFEPQEKVENSVVAERLTWQASGEYLYNLVRSI